MSRFAKGFLVSAPVLFMVSCAGMQLEKAQRVSPEGSAFNVLARNPIGFDAPVEKEA